MPYPQTRKNSRFGVTFQRPVRLETEICTQVVSKYFDPCLNCLQLFQRVRKQLYSRKMVPVFRGIFSYTLQLPAACHDKTCQPYKRSNQDTKKTNLLSSIPLSLLELRLEPADIKLFILRPYSDCSFPYRLDTGVGVWPFSGGVIQKFKSV